MAQPLAHDLFRDDHSLEIQPDCFFCGVRSFEATVLQGTPRISSVAGVRRQLSTRPLHPWQPPCHHMAMNTALQSVQRTLRQASSWLTAGRVPEGAGAARALAVMAPVSEDVQLLQKELDTLQAKVRSM